MWKKQKQNNSYVGTGDDRIFTFTMPNDAPAKPKSNFIIGLTADIGQTDVSNASMVALGNLKADVILISGDLSYADGWHPRWDTFGRLWEKVVSQSCCAQCLSVSLCAFVSGCRVLGICLSFSVS